MWSCSVLQACDDTDFGTLGAQKAGKGTWETINFCHFRNRHFHSLYTNGENDNHLIHSAFFAQFSVPTLEMWTLLLFLLIRKLKNQTLWPLAVTPKQPCPGGTRKEIGRQWAFRNQAVVPILCRHWLACTEEQDHTGILHSFHKKCQCCQDTCSKTSSCYQEFTCWQQDESLWTPVYLRAYWITYTCFLWCIFA